MRFTLKQLRYFDAALRTGSIARAAVEMYDVPPVEDPYMEVKASGGVRTTDDAKNMINAGADRIGASASIAIVTGKKPGVSKY